MSTETPEARARRALLSDDRNIWLDPEDADNMVAALADAGSRAESHEC